MKNLNIEFTDQSLNDLNAIRSYFSDRDITFMNESEVVRLALHLFAEQRGLRSGG